MNDLLGLGKVLPMDKLLDILTKSVGAIMKPYFDRRDIDTKAYELKKLTEAKVESIKTIATAIKENATGIGGINYNENGITIESSKQSQNQFVQSLPEASLEERTRTRVDYQEAKKQQNIEGVTAFAAEELKDEPPITNEPVDEGWSSRFFKYAEEISDEEMQVIWGKILAGEIKQPNTYALRTLEVLRNLSRQEANIFSKAANFALESGNDILLFRGNDEKLGKYGLGYSELSILREAGILHEGEFTTFNLEANTSSQTVFTCGHILVLLQRQPSPNKMSVPVYVFTQVGKQLLKLIKPMPNSEYLNEFASSLKDDNSTVKYGFILGRNDGLIHHTQPLSDFPL